MQIFSIPLPKRAMLLAAGDYAALLIGFVLAVVPAHPIDPAIYLLYEGKLQAAMVMGAFGIFGMFLVDRYSNVRVTSRMHLITDIASVCGMIFLGNATLLSLNLDFLVFDSLSMFLGTTISAVLLILWRILYSTLLAAALPVDRIVFLGYVPEVEATRRKIHTDPVLGISIAGYAGEPSVAAPPEMKYLGPFDEFARIMDTQRPNRVVVASSDHRSAGLQRCLFDLHRRQVSVERFGKFYERVLQRVCTTELRPAAVVFERELDARPRKLALQSVYTNLLTLVGAVALLPLLLLVALAIRVTSRGPAIESRRRLGLNGIPFDLFEFRCHDAGGRRTGLGAWLRRRGLHRMPVLLNMLRGEIALIGPPPQHPEFASVLSHYLPYNSQRQSVRPGFIGWSQLKCSVDAPDEIARIQYDLYYIKHISLSLDFYIVLTSMRTALGVLAGNRG